MGRDKNRRIVVGDRTRQGEVRIELYFASVRACRLTFNLRVFHYTHYWMSPIDSAAISRSRMVTFLRSSRAMPCAGPVSLAIAGVLSALLQALTHQPTFGNNLVAFVW